MKCCCSASCASWARCDEVLLQRVVRILGTVAAPLVVVAAPDQALPPLPEDVTVVRDSVKDRGPLQGIADGLRAVSPRAESAYVSSCDAPLLSPAFVRAVADRLDDHEIAVPVADGFHHTLAAVYRTSVLAHVDALLADDRMRPFFLFERARTREIPESELRVADPQLNSLRNMNTPLDYEAILGELGL